MKKETLEKAKKLDYEITNLKHVESRVGKVGCQFATGGQFGISLHLCDDNFEKLRKYVLRMVRSELRKKNEEMSSLR